MRSFPRMRGSGFAHPESLAMSDLFGSPLAAFSRTSFAGMMEMATPCRREVDPRRAEAMHCPLAPPCLSSSQDRGMQAPRTRRSSGGWHRAC